MFGRHVVWKLSASRDKTNVRANRTHKRRMVIKSLYSAKNPTHNTYPQNHLMLYWATPMSDLRSSNCSFLVSLNVCECVCWFKIIVYVCLVLLNVFRCVHLDCSHGNTGMLVKCIILRLTHSGMSCNLNWLLCALFSVEIIASLAIQPFPNQQLRASFHRTAWFMEAVLIS